MKMVCVMFRPYENQILGNYISDSQFVISTLLFLMVDSIFAIFRWIWKNIITNAFITVQKKGSVSNFCLPIW